MLGTRETGNETYVVNLLRHLQLLPGVECGAVVLPGCIAPPGLDGVEFLTLRSTNNWLRLLYDLPVVCKDWQADVLHVTYVGPFFPPCPMIVSVHDVSFRRFPQFFTFRDRLLFATLLQMTLRQASAVVAISEHARQEILTFYGFLRGRVHLTFAAPSPLFRPIASRELLDDMRSRYGIDSDFVLAVGNLQPRKNLVRLIDAFDSIHGLFPSTQLVVTGQARWQSSAVYDRVKSLGLEQHIVFTGYVPDQDLALLYNAAQVFVYVSLYEGFGLPIVEAMACGTPVITSRCSSMAETAGEAALQVDPYSVADIAEAIREVLSNQNLRRTLSVRGIAQASRFSWLDTARQTLEVYQSIARSHEPDKCRD